MEQSNFGGASDSSIIILISILFTEPYAAFRLVIVCYDIAKSSSNSSSDNFHKSNSQFSLHDSFAPQSPLAHWQSFSHLGMLQPGAKHLQPAVQFAMSQPPEKQKQFSVHVRLQPISSHEHHACGSVQVSFEWTKGTNASIPNTNIIISWALGGVPAHKRIRSVFLLGDDVLSLTSH